MRLRTTLVDSIMHVMDSAFDPTFGEAWNRRQIGDALSMPNTHALVVDVDGRLVENSGGDAVGFVLTRHAPGEEELLLIAVSPQHRGKGLAQALIDRLFEAARGRGAARIYLEMRRGNPAIHLYEKVGFEPIGMRPNYYRTANGERIDAITFGRSI
ncbi:MAG: GNAT family N-acetyltransferase [Erythrobacter sp.]|nr:GNAT family N-acetyltransferase [Erythrobacter sp.]